ncbi:hypothetical protein SRABI128_06307 [Microbacterium sp. Bi128]|nr:hypothetical protein SRABI128_06307 [Microbacterium sp. Bi128]
MVITRMVARETLMPAVRAALGLAPTARNSKPSVERFSSHETNTVAAMASRNPRCSRYWLPKISGYAALGSTMGDIGVSAPGRWNKSVSSR